MIKKIEHKKQMYVPNIDKYKRDKKHIEEHLVTTWYFLFIPIFQTKKLLTSTL